MRNLAIAIMALAAVLAAPALADMPQGCGLGEPGEPGHGGLGGAHGWMLLLDDETKSNLQNMTIAEIEALKEQKSQELMNMTLAQIEELRQQKMKERENMTLAELKSSMHGAQGKGGFGGKCPMGEMGGPGCCRGDDRGMGPGPKMAHPFLLMDDLTASELNNMTLAEIKALEQKKMEELNNMTLAEIKELWQQKRDELNNMTPSELKERCGHPGRMDGPGMGFGPEMRPPAMAEVVVPPLGN